MRRLSIIIPLTGNIQAMEDTLVSVLENRPDDCQIVVVLNAVYADPYELKSEVCFVYAPIGCETVECINRGLDAAEGEIVHVLAAGVEVSPDWTAAAMQHFSDHKIAAVAPLILQHDDPKKIVSAAVEYHPGGAVRRVAQGLDISEVVADAQSPGSNRRLCTDQLAGFYRKTAVDIVDRFCLDTGADFCSVDLTLKLREAGVECVFEPNCRVYAQESILSKRLTILRALQAERLFWRWAPSRGWLRSLLAHACALAWEPMIAFPRPAMFAQLAGRCLGLCGMGLHGSHYRKMALLRQRAAYAHSPHAPTVSMSEVNALVFPSKPSGRGSSSAKAV